MTHRERGKERGTEIESEGDGRVIERLRGRDRKRERESGGGGERERERERGSERERVEGGRDDCTVVFCPS